MIDSLQWSRQSVVSCIILALLACIGATVLWVHEKTSQIPADLFPQLATAPPIGEPLELLPGLPLILPAGFEPSGGQELYDTESLYEKINGKAPLYLEAGFVGLTTRRFIFKEDPSLWFELYVYDMGTALNAFSVYSTQKRPGTERDDALEGLDHYLTENGLYLHRGPYYIELIGSSASDQLKKAMVSVGREMLGAETDEGEALAELQLFPAEGLEPGSFKLIRDNAFGSEVLRNTFVAKYEVNGQSISAFIAGQKSTAEAQKVAERYLQFLVEGGGTAEEPVESMQLVDLYGLVEIVFTVGPYVAGVHEGENRDDALETARHLRHFISEKVSQ